MRLGLLLPFSFLSLRVSLLGTGSVLVDVNEVLDQADDHEDREDQCGKEPQEQVSSEDVFELTHTFVNIVSL